MDEQRIHSRQSRNIETQDPAKKPLTDEERQKILIGLSHDPSPENLRKLNFQEINERLNDLAQLDDSPYTRVFRRFRNAFLLALLHAQHEIVLIEEEIAQGNFSNLENGRLDKLLLNYSSLMEAYQKSHMLKQASTTETEEYSKFMATQLHEPRYYYANNDLGLISFRIDEARGTHDIVRKFLQQKLPVRFLDAIGKERRELERVEGKGGLPSGSMARVIEQYRRHGRYISPSVDNFARILFALIGGVFLLAPMIAMAFITSKKYLLLTTVLFVLVFSVSLGLVSKASNQELVAATAAYAAVLVVFVGNNIGPSR